MLDVHPAHHAAGTWREFLVHIATIVLGLLIAIGLEQTVEHIHHRLQATEARDLLRVERNMNRTSLAIDIYTTERNQRDLRRDLDILRGLRTHAPTPDPTFILRRFSYGFFSEAWKNVHESGTINYLKPDDLRALDYLYELQGDFTAGVAESRAALAHAASVFTAETGPLRTFSQAGEVARFVDEIGRGKMDEAAADRGYAPLVEQADLSKLTAAEIAELERAIKIAIVDNERLLSTCFNIQLVLNDRLAQDK